LIIIDTGVIDTGVIDTGQDTKEVPALSKVDSKVLRVHPKSN
jgi:hypothetical protein